MGRKVEPASWGMLLVLLNMRESLLMTSSTEKESFSWVKNTFMMEILKMAKNQVLELGKENIIMKHMQVSL